MQLDELKLLSNLIHSYGVKEIKRIIDCNEKFLEYLNIYNSLLYTENDNYQLFTNQQTSVFCLNKKNIDYDYISSNIDKENIKIATKEEINKYLTKVNNLFGLKKNDVSLINYAGMVIGGFSVIDKININEAKLIQLLLKNPKMYTSKEKPILYAESEQGYAYVLGSKNGKQFKF